MSLAIIQYPKSYWKWIYEFYYVIVSNLVSIILFWASTYQLSFQCFNNTFINNDAENIVGLVLPLNLNFSYNLLANNTGSSKNPPAAALYFTGSSDDISSTNFYVGYNTFSNPAIYEVAFQVTATTQLFNLSLNYWSYISYSAILSR